MENTETLVPLAHRIPEACRRLGIGRSMFYELVEAGEITTFRIGGRVLVPESELVNLIRKLMEDQSRQKASHEDRSGHNAA